MTNVAKLPTTNAEGPTFLDYVVHELANVFEMIKGKEFEELCIDIKANGIHTPIVLYDDGSGLKILDGRNRYASAKAVGHRFTSANFKTFEGDLNAAETFVNSVNVNRRHLTNAQKQAYIRTLIIKYPDKSNRQIAKKCGFSPTTVGEVREKLLNPPELVKFREFKKTWEELPDNQRTEFVKEFKADIGEMLEAN
jgi:ParB-like chromosome segregation protein Spo0J